MAIMQIFVKCYTNFRFIISGTNCDRDNPYFLQKEGVNKIELRHKIGIKLDQKSEKRG